MFLYSYYIRLMASNKIRYKNSTLPEAFQATMQFVVQSTFCDVYLKKCQDIKDNKKEKHS